MISNLILNLIYGLLFGVFSLLPSVEAFPSTFNDAINFMASSLSHVFYVFPSGVSEAILLVLQTIVNSILVLFVIWLFFKIWGVIRG